MSADWKNRKPGEIVEFDGIRGELLETIPASPDGDKPQDEQVGHGRPPKSGQQKPNQPSKNPNGRPLGIPNPGKFTRKLMKRVEARLPDGSARVMTNLEAILHVVAVYAAKGDLGFRKLLDKRLKQEAEQEALERQAAEAERQARQSPLGKTERYLKAQRALYDYLLNADRAMHEIIDWLRLNGAIEFNDGKLIVAQWLADVSPPRSTDP